MGTESWQSEDVWSFPGRARLLVGGRRLGGTFVRSVAGQYSREENPERVLSEGEELPVPEVVSCKEWAKEK